MTEAEHHQQELEHQEQALDQVAERVRKGVLGLPFNEKLGLVGELDNHQFMIVTFDMRKYIVKIEEA